MVKNRIIWIVSIIIILLLGIFVIRNNIDDDLDSINKIEDHSFELQLIKEVENEENVLISPYSIKIALNMLKEGTNGDSLKQINRVIGNNDINIIRNDSVGMANGVFIKDKYRKEVSNKYIKLLKNDYKADVVFDSFQGPDRINNWVNDKTKKMIPKLMDSIDGDFVLALVNALSVDVKWADPFKCVNTQKEVFYKDDGTQINVAMMHKDSNGIYFETDDAKGVILPYKAKKGKQLEMIAILPNENLKSYIELFNDEELRKIDDYKESNRVSLYFPKFSYEYDWKSFKESLQNMGIKDVFDSGKADLSRMFDGASDYYVSKAIHKTYIDLDEEGTKAAATTGFVISKNAAEAEDKIIITFNKPFIYIIRDKDSNEFLFYGIVNHPNKWEGKSCE